MQCTCCEEEFENVDDGRENDVGEWYCDDCYNERYDQCNDCQCEVVSDDTFYDRGDYYCDDCVDTHYPICDHCGERADNERCTTIRNGDRVCEECDGRYYSHCDCCDEVVPDGDWCSSCDSCEDCCRCDYCPDCDEHNDECTCNWCEDCDNHIDDCSCEESETVTRAIPFIRTSALSPFTDNGGNPVALIERLDNTKFELIPTNVDKVLGMLGNKGKLSSVDILGSLCTGDSSYFLIEDVVRDVGKVVSPRYIYGVRSNEYDIVIDRVATSDVLNYSVISKLRALGLTYTYSPSTYSSSSKAKVGLSFKVRKRQYRKCIEFLKFYCNI